MDCKTKDDYSQMDVASSEKDSDSGTTAQKKKMSRVIEANKLILGKFKEKELSSQYMHLKFDRGNKLIEIFVFKISPENYWLNSQSVTSFNGSSSKENQDKELQMKIVIKKKQLLKIELDSIQNVLLIQFKQAIIFKYLNEQWRPKEIWNNSCIKLAIIEQRTVQVLKKKLQHPQNLNKTQSSQVKLKQNNEQKFTYCFNFGVPTAIVHPN